MSNHDNELNWAERGQILDKNHEYKLHNMEQGSSPTPPPHGSYYYLNTKEEEQFSEEERKSSQDKRNEDLKSIEERKKKELPKKIELPIYRMYPVSEPKANEEYKQVESAGLTFGGKRKSKKLIKKHKNKSKKFRRKLWKGGNDEELKKNLFYACEHGDSLQKIKKMFKENSGKIKMLLESKNENNDTPLHVACINRYHDIVKVLLENGADMEAKNNSGYTPLHIACEKDVDKVVGILLEKGADIEALDNKERTPLILSSEVDRDGGDIPFKLLIEKGANIHATDMYGYNTLHRVCEKGETELAMLLLKYGADVNERAKDDYTPLHYACHTVFLTAKKKLETAKMLLINDADHKLTNSFGKKPFDFIDPRECRKYMEDFVKNLESYSFSRSRIFPTEINRYIRYINDGKSHNESFEQIEEDIKKYKVGGKCKTKRSRNQRRKTKKNKTQK